MNEKKTTEEKTSKDAKSPATTEPKEAKADFTLPKGMFVRLIKAASAMGAGGNAMIPKVAFDVENGGKDGLGRLWGACRFNDRTVACMFDLQGIQVGSAGSLASGEPARLVKMLELFGDEESLHVEVEGSRVVIQGERSRFQIGRIPREEVKGADKDRMVKVHTGHYLAVKPELQHPGAESWKPYVDGGFLVASMSRDEALAIMDCGDLLKSSDSGEPVYKFHFDVKDPYVDVGDVDNKTSTAIHHKLRGVDILGTPPEKDVKIKHSKIAPTWGSLRQVSSDEKSPVMVVIPPGAMQVNLLFNPDKLARVTYSMAVVTPE